jgi:hypothetical protein
MSRAVLIRTLVIVHISTGCKPLLIIVEENADALAVMDTSNGLLVVSEGRGRLADEMAYLRKDVANLKHV